MTRRDRGKAFLVKAEDTHSPIFEIKSNLSLSPSWWGIFSLASLSSLTICWASWVYSSLDFLTPPLVLDSKFMFCLEDWFAAATATAVAAADWADELLVECCCCFAWRLEAWVWAAVLSGRYPTWFAEVTPDPIGAWLWPDTSAGWTCAWVERGEFWKRKGRELWDERWRLEEKDTRQRKYRHNSLVALLNTFSERSKSPSTSVRSLCYEEMRCRVNPFPSAFNYLLNTLGTLKADQDERWKLTDGCVLSWSLAALPCLMKFLRLSMTGIRLGLEERWRKWKGRKR